MANDYISNELDKLKPLATQMDGDHFYIKLSSPSGTTNWLNIDYNTYFKIAQILLEVE